MRIHCLMSALVLAGCAAPYTWEHPGLDPVAAERQGDIDSAECAAFALQSVPGPGVALPPQTTTNAPRHYSVNGEATIYDQNGGTYTGHYSGTANSGASEPISPAISYSQGAAAEQLEIDNWRRSEVVRDLTNACMLRRGWVKVRTGQQMSLAFDPTVATQNERAPAQPDREDIGARSQPAAPADKPPQTFEDWQASHGN
jgi:hypothetical protein